MTDEQLRNAIADALKRLPHADVIVPDDLWARDYADCALGAIEEAGFVVGWIEDQGLKTAPRDRPIQVHRNGWAYPRGAKWSSGGWWINGERYLLELDRWAPMLPLSDAMLAAKDAT